MKYIETSFAQFFKNVESAQCYRYSCLYIIIPELVLLSFPEQWYSIAIHSYLSSKLIINVLSNGGINTIKSLNRFYNWIDIIAFIMGWSFIIQNSGWAKIRGIRSLHLFAAGTTSRIAMSNEKVKKTYLMINALFNTFFSIPVFIMLLLWGNIIYLYSVILYSVLGQQFPLQFANIGISYITVTKFCFGAGWTDAILIINYNQLYFILFSSLTLLNLGIMNSLVGIYVNAFSDALKQEISD
tara:strand:- start:144 stop:866 length:723 start_codon:yes stop_codon:yes gene_type:complete